MFVCILLVFISLVVTCSAKKPPYKYVVYAGEDVPESEMESFISITMPANRCKISFENPDTNSGVECGTKRALKVEVRDFSYPSVLVSPTLDLITVIRRPDPETNRCEGEAIVKAMRDCKKPDTIRR